MYSVFPYIISSIICVRMCLLLHWFTCNFIREHWLETSCYTYPYDSYISALCTACVVTDTILWVAFNITVVVPLNKLLIHSFVCLSSFLALSWHHFNHVLRSLVLMLIHNYLFLKSPSTNSKICHYCCWILSMVSSFSSQESNKCSFPGNIVIYQALRSEERLSRVCTAPTFKWIANVL